MKLRADQTTVPVGFLHRLQKNDHFWKWVLKYGTHLSSRKFIQNVEEALNSEIIKSKHVDARRNRIKEKSEVLLFMNKNKDNLEKYFKEYNNVKNS